MESVLTIVLTTVLVFIVEKALVQIYNKLIGKKKNKRS